MVGLRGFPGEPEGASSALDITCPFVARSQEQANGGLRETKGMGGPHPKERQMLAPDPLGSFSTFKRPTPVKRSPPHGETQGTRVKNKLMRSQLRGVGVAFGPTVFSYHNLGHLEHVKATPIVPFSPLFWGRVPLLK